MTMFLQEWKISKQLGAQIHLQATTTSDIVHKFLLTIFFDKFLRAIVIYICNHEKIIWSDTKDGYLHNEIRLL